MRRLPISGATGSDWAMGCGRIIPSPESSAVLLRRAARAARASPQRRLRRARVVACLGSGDPPAAVAAAVAGGRSAGAYSVDFRTLAGCKLGISRYPDFDYDASGGAGTAAAAEEGEEILVTFDAGSLYIPPLMTATTRFLGLPLPPFLKIEIVPESFQGIINRETGQANDPLLSLSPISATDHRIKKKNLAVLKIYARFDESH